MLVSYKPLAILELRGFHPAKTLANRQNALQRWCRSLPEVLRIILERAIHRCGHYGSPGHDRPAD